MSEDVTIDTATQEDASTIAAFNCAMALETEGIELEPGMALEGARTLIAQPSLGFYLVARIGTDVVASLMVTFEWSDWKNGAYWWIQSVFVRQNMRRRGIYRRLYEYVLASANCDPRFKGLRLYVDRGNVSAQKTYHALGMEESHYMLFELRDRSRG